MARGSIGNLLSLGREPPPSLSLPPSLAPHQSAAAWRKQAGSDCLYKSPITPSPACWYLSTHVAERAWPLAAATGTSTA